MSPTGIEVNKKVVVLIVGLIAVIFLAFQYMHGSESDVVELSQEYKLSKHSPDTNLVKNFKVMDTEEEVYENWKTVNLDLVKVPDDIENKVAGREGSYKIETKTFKVMDCDIFARTMKPRGKCKGGVLLLHGQAFTSKNWEDIKTIKYIAAMGYTPMAIDLPNYGNSKCPDGKPIEDKAKFMEELIKVLEFNAPVIVSPSMSGTFALPYLLKDPENAEKKVHGYIPVAPVIPDELKSKIKDFKAPAALVYGGNDKTFGPNVENILSKMPNSRLFKIDGAGHACYMNNPDQWHKILFVFIKAAFHYERDFFTKM